MKTSHTQQRADNPNLPATVIREIQEIFIRLREASSLSQMVAVVLTEVRYVGILILQIRLEQRDEDFRKKLKKVLCPHCKSEMKKCKRLRRKRRYTFLGALWYYRCQYSCPSCKHRLFPLDESLKLAKALRGHGELFGKTLVLLCTLMPFGKGSDLFGQLCGFSVSSRLARALTLTIGIRLFKDEISRAKELWEKRYKNPEIFEPPPAQLRRMRRHRRVYVMMDNSKIGIQEGPRGRHAKEQKKMLRKVAQHEKKKSLQAAKRKAKSGTTPAQISSDLQSVLDEEGDSWRDVRALLIFSEDDLANPSKNRREILRRRVVGHIGTKEEWTRFMHMAFHEEGVYTAHEVIFIADGGQGIWELFSELVPPTEHRRVVQILDWFHAVQKIWKVGRALKGSRTKDQQKACQKWVKVLVDYLAEGKVSNVLQRLKKIKKASDTARKELDKAIDYFEKHRRRMHYRDFRNRKLLIGSGAIESIHAWVIQPRCRLPGMRWSVLGANAIVRLRCSWASGRWDDDFARAANGPPLSNRELKIAEGKMDP